MGLDMRLPIGIIFIIYGLLISIFGFVANPAIFQSPLGLNIELRLYGVNIDILWGGAMLVFGLVMGGLAFRTSRQTPP
jgi:hypothetical protein